MNLRYPRPRVYGVLENCRPPRHDLKDAVSRSAPGQRFRARLRSLSDRAGPAFVERRCLTVDWESGHRLCHRSVALVLAVLLRLGQPHSGLMEVGLDLLAGLLEPVVLPVDRLLGVVGRLLDFVGHVVGHVVSPFVAVAEPPRLSVPAACCVALTLWSFSDKWMTRRHAFCVIRKRAAA